MSVLYSLLIIIFFVTVGSIFLFTFYYFRKPNLNRLNFVHRFIVTRIVNKWVRVFDSSEKDLHPLMDSEKLLSGLNFSERALAERIFSIDPDRLGIRTPKYKTGLPEKIKKLEAKVFTGGRESGVQYIPDHIYDDFNRLAAAMKQDLNKTVYIDSGFRSNGRQSFLFLKYLAEENNFSLIENAKWSAMPGYSEHGDPINTAVDFSNEDGINGFSEGQSAADFEKLKEYDWLLKNADKFNFFLSYPRDNKTGISFEPWHWHWEKNGIQNE